MPCKPLHLLLGLILLQMVVCTVASLHATPSRGGRNSGLPLNRQRRVIGGEVMSDKEHSKFPWAALLRGQNAAKRGSYHWCGATILDKEWLVTAAHCFWRTDDDDPFIIIDMRNTRHWHVSLGNVSVEHDRFLEIIAEPNTMDELEDVPVNRPKKPKYHFFNQNDNNRHHFKYRLDMNDVLRDMWQEHMRVMHLLRHLMDENNFSKWHRTSYKDTTMTTTQATDKVSKQIPSTTTPRTKQLSNDHPYHYHLKKIFLHPFYRPHRIAYDIALIKLEKPIQEMEKWAVHLPNVMNFPLTGANCTLVGWGCTSDKGTASELSHSIDLEVMNFHQCNHLYRYSADLNHNHEFCAGFDNQDKGICRGDSGSGLVCLDHETQKWVVAGIASATHGKNPSSYPGVFTRTSFAKNWMMRIMQRYSTKN